MRITSAGRVGGVEHGSRNLKARRIADLPLLFTQVFLYFKIKITLAGSSCWLHVFVSVCIYG
jgi:hypothetical protein